MHAQFGVCVFDFDNVRHLLLPSWTEPFSIIGFNISHPPPPIVFRVRRLQLRPRYWVRYHNKICTVRRCVGAWYYYLMLLSFTTTAADDLTAIDGRKSPSFWQLPWQYNAAPHSTRRTLPLTYHRVVRSIGSNSAVVDFPPNERSA